MMRKTTLLIGCLLLSVSAFAQSRLKPVYRVVNGVTNEIYKAEGWYNARGKVLQKVRTGTFLVEVTLEGQGDYIDSATYLLKNFVYDFVDGEKLSGIRVKDAGKSYEYTTVLGAKRTVRVLDYGIPVNLPPPAPVKLTPAQLAAKAEQDKKTAEKVLKFQQDQAEKGSPSAQYDLAMRYATGDGVPQDPNQARAWLEKSAAQDYPQAKAALKKLASKE